MLSISCRSMFVLLMFVMGCASLSEMRNQEPTGCGSAEAWNKSKHLNDLPGCLTDNREDKTAQDLSRAKQLVFRLRQASSASSFNELYAQLAGILWYDYGSKVDAPIYDEAIHNLRKTVLQPLVRTDRRLEELKQLLAQGIDPRLENELGLNFMFKGNYAEAARYFRNAISHAAGRIRCPDILTAWKVNLAHSLRLAGEHNAVPEILPRPETSDEFWELSQAYIGLKDHTKTGQMLEQYAEVDTLKLIRVRESKFFAVENWSDQCKEFINEIEQGRDPYLVSGLYLEADRPLAVAGRDRNAILLKALDEYIEDSAPQALELLRKLRHTHPPAELSELERRDTLIKQKLAEKNRVREELRQQAAQAEAELHKLRDVSRQLVILMDDIQSTNTQGRNFWEAGARDIARQKFWPELVRLEGKMCNLINETKRLATPEEWLDIKVTAQRLVTISGGSMAFTQLLGEYEKASKGGCHIFTAQPWR